MNQKKRSKKEKALCFLRLQTHEAMLRTILGALIGAASYIALYQVSLPSYKLMGMLTVQIDPAILGIPIAGAFFGPLAGLLAGLLGAFGADALFTHQIIAFGIINLSYGLLGLIAGIPHYAKGFSSGRTLGKLTLFTMGGFLIMALVYLGGLIEVAGQNMLPTLLYNFLPFVSVSLITLFLLTPVAVRLIDILAKYARSWML